MSFDGNGNWTYPAGSLGVSGQVIDSTKYNAVLTDLQTALTKCFLRDGQSAALANLPMGGFKLTGLAAGATNGESVRYEQVAALALSQGAVGGRVSQTVVSGPVDSSGFSAFGGAPGSTTVTATGTLRPLATNGLIDRLGSTTNPSWTGLNSNGTMYLYLDVAADGSCGTGSGTLAPNYRWGGADVITNNQFTYNVSEGVGKVGNGAAAVQTYRVYVGQVTVAGSVVTAILWYALQGRYDSGWTATLPGVSTQVVKNHNIGVAPELYDFVVENTTTEGGYAVGQRLKSSSLITSEGNRIALPLAANSINVFIMSTGSTFAFGTLNSSAAGLILTAANWKYKFTAQRGW